MRECCKDSLEKNMNKIIVVGSSNMDMVVKTDRLPRPGETILGGSFLMNPGGKGANQAVTIARLGGDVLFITKLGSDLLGKQLQEGFRKDKIPLQGVLKDEDIPTGVALINVDRKGENCIAVAPGSNWTLSAADIDTKQQYFQSSTFLLMQLEIPLQTVEHTIAMAKKHQMKTVLNPAPATQLSSQLLKGLFAITPNETEAEILTGIKIADEITAAQAAQKLRDMGIENVIITLGKKGAFLHNDEFNMLIPAPKANVIDTTAAGDVFNGALVVALAENMTIKEAVEFACKAASLSVTKMGAQSSIPYREEVNKHFF